MASQVSCFLSQPARCRAFIHLSTSSDRWGFPFKHHISCWITDHADEARFLDAKFQLQVDPALSVTCKPQLLQKAVIYHLLHIEGRGLPQDGCMQYMDMMARYHCATKKLMFFARMRVKFDFNPFGRTVNIGSRWNWQGERFFPRLQQVVGNCHVWEIVVFNLFQHLSLVRARTV